MKFRKQSNCIYFCQYHIVLSTKFRKELFAPPGVFAYLKEILERVKEYYPEIDILEVNHDKDHIHMLVSIPPKLSVGKVVGIIKANTSRIMKDKFSFLKKAYWGTNAIWSEGYFVSTVGINEQQIQDYIQKQGIEDLGQAELELK
ncbi:MAG: IS200/IS605 family transposase [Patescibacteria group bacterium]